SRCLAVGACYVEWSVLMPLIEHSQSAPPPRALPTDPMRANFFILNLGLGAAAEALVGLLLFGAVIAAGLMLRVSLRAFAFAVGAAALAAAIALAVPTFGAQAGAARVAEGRIEALPASPVFISVLELPQPAGAVLGPHQHIAGFVVDVSGTASMAIAGDVVNVGPGAAFFTGEQQLHDHENRMSVPFAIANAFGLFGLLVALLPLSGRRPS